MRYQATTPTTLQMKCLLSSHDEALERLGDKILDRGISGYCYEHEICCSLTSGKSDFVEITPHLTGLTACTVRSGLAASEPAEFGEWTAQKTQSSIAAWQVILAADRCISSFILSFLTSGKEKQNVPSGISVLKFVAGRMTEDILLPSCTLLIRGFGCLSVVAL